MWFVCSDGTGGVTQHVCRTTDVLVRYNIVAQHSRAVFQFLQASVFDESAMEHSSPRGPAKRGLLFWAPRVLGLSFAVLISVFALDVIGEGYGFWETIAALLIHLVPTFVLLLVVAVSWCHEWVGALVFPAMGLIYLVQAWPGQHWTAYVLISGPLFVLGALFLASWFSQRPKPTAAA